MHPIIKRVFRGINRNVVAISVVSFLNDISSEMIYPVIPIFLVSVLNAPVTVVGLIEGIAEATANILRVFSGYFSDKFQRRKPFMIAGYALSTLSKLIIAAATGWVMVLGGRFLDRFGKGVRTAARDALLAGASDENHRGKVFGFHRGLDTLGAMTGPLTAFFLLTVFKENLRVIFYIALLPAVAGVILLGFFVRDIRRNVDSSSRASWTLRNVRLTRDFKVFLIVSIVFALGNSSDAFLILRAQNLGLSVGTTILAYTLFNTVYAIFSLPVGIISDRIGQKRVLLLGFALFSITYALLGMIGQPVFLWFLFPLYGIFMALTEGVSKAYISLHTKNETAGTIYGIYQTLTGLATFPASLTAGFLWKYINPGAPFIFGAVMAFIAFLIFGIMGGDNIKKNQVSSRA